MQDDPLGFNSYLSPNIKMTHKNTFNLEFVQDLVLKMIFKECHQICPLPMHNVAIENPFAFTLKSIATAPIAPGNDASTTKNKPSVKILLKKGANCSSEQTVLP